MFRFLRYQFRPARLFKDALGFLFAVTLMGGSAFSIPQGPVSQEKSVPLTRLVITFGTNTTSIWGAGIWDGMRIVIRDRATWENIWKRILSPDPYHDPYQAVPSLPQIDFSKEMLIVAAMGRRPSGGYRILIDRARETRTSIEVEVQNISSCGTAPAIMTAPIDIVRIPKTDLPVTFKEIEIRPGCK
jgi:protease stability complex PrcB-like protein